MSQLDLPRLTILCHIPPPVHGASVVGKMVADSTLLSERFDCTVIPIDVRKSDLDITQRLTVAKIKGSVALFGKLLQNLIRRRPDAVYMSVVINSFAAIRDLGFVLLCRLFGIPRILHLHMRGVRERYEASLAFRFLYRMMFGGAYVIHLSERLYQDVEHVVSRDNFRVVANGVKAPIAGHSEPPADRPRILFLSNLYSDKGPLLVLEASNRLHREGIPHQLVFAGARPDPLVNSVLDKAIAEDKDGRITACGPVYGAEKEALLRSAQIFAFPTYFRFECQPLSVIEAMSYGLAIVTSDYAGIPDLVRDEQDGLLVPLNDVEKLTEALRRLIKDDALRGQLARSAQTRYREMFTISSFEQRLVNTITGLVAPHGTS